MWPWEHAAVAYICYSLAIRLTRGDPPVAGPVLAVLVGSQLPDLVDKPLAWGVQLLPAGRSLAHSLVVALPFCTLAVLVAHQRHRTDAGLAFVIGYLSHLPGDVFYPVLLGEPPEFGFLLYPIVSRDGSVDAGLIATVSEYVGEFLFFLQTPRGIVYLGGELLLMGGALWLWIADGKPGLGPFRKHIHAAISG